jgi:hypothetical protein
MQYSKESEGLIDYKLWRPDGLDYYIRGPKVHFGAEAPILSYIGAAQTFGIFVKHPFAELVGEITGTQVLNLAKGGAGALFYTRRKPVIDLINSTSACIIQVMSPRSSMINDYMHHINCLASVRITKGRRIGETLLGHQALKLISEEVNNSIYRKLIKQTIANYMHQYDELLNAISVPKILIYISTANPYNSEDEIDPSCTGNLGAHPHMITREILGHLRGLVDNFIEVASTVGKGARLIDETGNFHVIHRKNLVIKDHSGYAAPPFLHLEAATKIYMSLKEIKIPQVS